MPLHDYVILKPVIKFGVVGNLIGVNPNYNMVTAMPADIIPDQLVEEALEAIADTLDKKLNGRWWVKPLYWISVIIVLAIPIVYYFW